MHMNSKSADLANGEVIGSTQSADSADHMPVGTTRPSLTSSNQPISGKVSDVGRALAPRGTDRFEPELDAARVASIRDRILEGAYDAAEVVDAVARRLLASGDL